MMMMVGVVSTLAGSYGNSSSIDGLGTSARFVTLYAMTLDTTSNVIYLMDSSSSMIRKVTTSGE